VTALPPPTDGDRSVAQRIGELDELVGRERFVEVCCDLLAGADRTSYVPELRYLTGHDWEPGDPVLDPTVWKDYWVRTWGARGLLHRWSNGATDAVVAGLGDEHYRPAEMCLKVSARHDVAGSGPGAAALAVHDLPRVRAAAARALAVVGDTEHAEVVVAMLDDPDESVRRHAARAYQRMAQRLDLAGLDALDPLDPSDS
jgi:HEAT repeat protein